MITIRTAKDIIEVYPKMEDFIEKFLDHNKDNSISLAEYWGRCFDMLQPYNPIGCDHKKGSGFSAWEIYSHSMCTGAVFSEETIMVCSKCGDIMVYGHNDLNRYEVTFAIHHPRALRAIIKQANYMLGEELFVENTKSEKEES